VPGIDHVGVETDDPHTTAEFYERIFGAHVVTEEGHPVMAYIGNTGFALHEKDGPAAIPRSASTTMSEPS
jgi:catechol 2,3-dioxygenase-like lactoylglutathione lyase family enzyme